MNHTSILIESPCELINLTPLNPLISRCQIKVCYVGDTPNRNGSIISKETAREMARSLPGSPIVGYYNEAKGDFEGHNRSIEIAGNSMRIKDTTQPYGFVDLNAKSWFQDYLDDGVVHTYLVTEGYLWTGQYPEAKRVLERGNNQSMELDENSLDGSWTIDDKSGMEFFIINEAIISKLCILGEDVEPCFEGARISEFSLDVSFNEKVTSLMRQVRELKGGTPIVEKEEKMTEFSLDEQQVEETVEQQEEETVEENFSLQEPEQTEEIEENSTIEENPVQEENANSINFELEYNALQASYSELETQYNELTTQYSDLENAYNELLQFKKEKELESKQAMIDSFYMLSDEDKKDVIDNIENYTLEEIEGKLAIICVHNKLNLSDEPKDDEKVIDAETTFSLNDIEEDENEVVPALVSLLRKNKKN